MRRDSLKNLILEALDTMALEAPAAYRALGQAWGPLLVHCRFIDEDEEALLAFHELHSSLETSSLPSDVFLETDRETFRDLARGDIDLESALRGDRIFLQGHAMDLKDIISAFHLFITGAAACPSFPRLLEKLNAPEQRTRK